MTDAELLDLAAKAMGYKYMNGALWDGRDVVEYSWNPLEDDGHALKLAVKLKLLIQTDLDGDPQVATNDYDFCEWEPCGGDPCAATRRAIVKTAAAIGESK